jgi:hypothetical protein
MIDSLCFLAEQKRVKCSYIRRNPSNSNVIAYAVKDSLLAIKVRYYGSTAKYYIINMNRDREIAKKEEYLIGTIAEAEFKESWLGKPKFEIVEE